MNHIDVLSVGELAARAGCKPETVRYYEKEGLMPAPARTEGGHRQYGADQLARLRFIRRGRELGFAVEQVRELLGYVDESGRSCGEVKMLAVRHIEEVERRIEDLQRMLRSLREMVLYCQGDRYTVENCPIIQALAGTEPGGRAA